MQIKTGTCAVTAGSERIIASAGNDWSQADIGSIFTVTGSGAWYEITSVIHPGVSDSGKWELTIAANYAGATEAAAAYSITVDFTETLGLPLPRPGDNDTATLFARAMQLLDAAISGLDGGITDVGESITHNHDSRYAPKEKTVDLQVYHSPINTEQNYRLTADFHTAGLFAHAFYHTKLTCSSQEITVVPEENLKTAGKASWIIYHKPGPYPPVYATFQASLRGPGWTGATTSMVEATWTLENLN